MTRKATTRKKPDKITAAFKAHCDMENAARYLNSGRRFAGLGTKALIAEWLAAFHDSSIELRQDRARDFDDLGAELSLRGMPRPEHLIPLEVKKQAAARLAPFMPRARQRWADSYYRFLDEWKSRRN